MKKNTINLLPQKLLGFRLLARDVIESCLKNSGCSGNAGIDRIESKVGNPKPGLASIQSKVGNNKIGLSKD